MSVVRFRFDGHAPLDVVLGDPRGDDVALVEKAWYHAGPMVSWGDTYADCEVLDNLPADSREDFVIRLTKTFEVDADGTGIKCLVCGMISYSPGDVKNKYCGKCHRFHWETP